MTKGFTDKLARIARPGFQKQRTRTAGGMRFVQVGAGGGRWQTEDGRFSVEVFEGYTGGWRLFDAEDRLDGETFVPNLRQAAAWIQRILKGEADATR